MKESPVESSVRDRRRAETVREIKAAALQQLAEGGTGALSLRGVARSIGMTVQSLYHYFDSRDALLTALVSDAHHQLADAVQAAADDTRGQPAAAPPVGRHGRLPRLGAGPPPGLPAALRDPGARLRAPARLRHRPGRLPAGRAVPGRGVRRVDRPQLAALPLPGDRTIDVPDTKITLPVGALAYFIELRGTMHGLVMLELLGHLYPFNAVAGDLYTAAMHRMSDTLDALQHGS